jgi:O-antigen/teichoic acid export membrane protein
MAPTFSPFWRNVFTLMSGTVLSQVLLLAFTPVLSRVFLPEAFGVMGAYLGALLVLTVIANGGYELAIMLPKEEEDAHQLTWLSISIGGISSLLVLGLAWVGGKPFLNWINLPELIGWHLMLPLSLLLEGIYQACYQALNRFKAYRILAASRLARAIVQIAVSLSLGLMGFGFEGLLAGLIAGQGVGGLLLLFFYVKRPLARKVIHHFSFSRMLKTGKAYRDFPIFAMASNGLNTAGKQLPYFFLPRLFEAQGLGKTMSGNFQQTQKLLSLPIGVLGVSLGSVFYERASRAQEEGGKALSDLTLKTTKTLFLLGLGPSIIVMLFGPELFTFVLGDDWEIAGRYARWLMPWFYLTFVAVPLSYLVDVKRKLHVYLILNILLFCGQLAALLLGSIWLSNDYLILLYGAVSAVLAGVQIVYFLYLRH